MQKAYILINCESGYESLVATSIKSVDNVLTCNIVYGVYDILIEIMFDTLKQLEYIIKNRIRKINKIQSTMTLIPFEFKWNEVSLYLANKIRVIRLQIILKIIFNLSELYLILSNKYKYYDTFPWYEMLIM